MVVITGSDVDNADIRLPTAKANSILIFENTNDPPSPDVVVGSLDGVTADEASEIPDTSHVIVTMTVENQPADSENAKQQGIDEICGNAAVSFIDIALVKQIDNGASVNIKETGSRLMIVIPFDTKNKNNITVYRYHDGEAALANTAEHGDYFTVGNGCITIYTSKFSTYAMSLCCKRIGMVLWRVRPTQHSNLLRILHGECL